MTLTEALAWIENVTMRNTYHRDNDNNQRWHVTITGSGWAVSQVIALTDLEKHIVQTVQYMEKMTE